MSYVSYLVTNLINGKRYVGITNKTIQKRWDRHCKDAMNGATNLLQRAIRKYGKSAFTIVELHTYASAVEAKSDEIRLIAELKTFSFDVDSLGYNMTRGGDGAIGYRFSDEQKAKMSARAKESNPMRGKMHSEETKRQMSESHKLTIHSPETLEQMQLRCAQMGKRNTGKKHSEQARKNMSEGHKIPIQQCSIDGVLVAEYPSALDAEASTGVKRQHIWRCCNGIRKSAKGFTWRYASYR